MSGWISIAAAGVVAVTLTGLRRRRGSPARMPSAGVDPSRRVVIRSRVAWTVLAVAFLITLSALGLSARTQPPGAQLLPPGKDAIVVLDLSSSLRASSVQVANALEQLTRDGKRRLGLVVFSDTAYEALPPSTSVEGLRGWLRIFQHDAPKAYPWTPSFSNGTWISSGLELARLAIRQDHVQHPHVILVSDLVDASPDQGPLENVAAKYQREGIDLRVLRIPTDKSQRGRANAFTVPNVTFVERGASRTVAPARVRRPELHTGLLIALVVALAVVAALYEQLFHPLVWRSA